MSFLLCIGFVLCSVCEADWGFFGHRQINRHAVYIMPAPINQFFKKHIAYLEEHSVDPDKRRYAVPGEYKRHYIDLDLHERVLGRPLTRNLEYEIRAQLKVKVVTQRNDTLTLAHLNNEKLYIEPGKPDCPWPGEAVDALIQQLRDEDPQDEIWVAGPDMFSHFVNQCSMAPTWKSLIIEDHFSIHGILPYWLVTMQRRLTNAFLRKDIPQILRLAADMGHYISDAHVPLHTTENYNGQLSSQHGIHGFWESRIPELFFEEWNLVTGKAEYIDHFEDRMWEIVQESNALVAEVLQLELEVRQSMPPDKIMCYEDRLTQNILTYCPAFARAYAQAMQGMVDDRMRASIHTVASVWYTAWIDAGQPPLWDVSTQDLSPLPEEEPVITGPQLGRPHDN